MADRMGLLGGIPQLFRRLLKFGLGFDPGVFGPWFDLRLIDPGGLPPNAWIGCRNCRGLPD